MSLSGPIDTAQLRVISLGAGVQSTCMALMAAHGEITPMPDYAVFADTQAEPAAVYDHLRWLMSDNVLPFPVHIVTNGSLTDDVLVPRPNGETTKMDIPAFSFNEDGTKSMVTRQCTRDYKVRPVHRELKRLLGITRKKPPTKIICEQWMGISIDEIQRMKDASEPWLGNRWPLIEKRMNRSDCLGWMEKHGYPRPARSACTFCPYHSDSQWKEMKRTAPADFAEAVAVDRRLRQPPPPGYRHTTTGKLYLHRNGTPLEDIDFTTPEDHGQLDMFMEDCDGMCGV